MRVQMMEVRCCCRPQKLLGWLPVAEGQRQVQYLVREPMRVNINATEEQRTRLITLPVAEFHPAAGGAPYFALKSEETPLEDLRLLPSFREATDADQS